MLFNKRTQYTIIPANGPETVRYKICMYNLNSSNWTLSGPWSYGFVLEVKNPCPASSPALCATWQLFCSAPRVQIALLAHGASSASKHVWALICPLGVPLRAFVWFLSFGIVPEPHANRWRIVDKLWTLNVKRRVAHEMVYCKLVMEVTHICRSDRCSWKPDEMASQNTTYSGMIWYGIMWYDMTWYNMLWHDVTCYDILLCDMTWCDIICYGVVWYNMT